MVNLVGTKISFSVFADFKEVGKFKCALIKETEKVRRRRMSYTAKHQRTKEKDARKKNLRDKVGLK